MGYDGLMGMRDDKVKRVLKIYHTMLQTITDEVLISPSQQCVQQMMLL